ncbi:hypothetical protein [Gloeobacter kilaueensis]|uniref:Uncharacterized protein n=1 Tax=Gloeobacter kilaueensis (strain ATCC BAA-2537 / CCAP 1431/1 / ULC 316 / JS1) TaxID=1183438 RepID=U5QG40_GLOK1|nr:hypothetical protein [Gloeobacter kilaueensis]AGY56645.1 hypothetical protein GKIL_0398 [Gloeobacter kilaueensis JS1]
MNSLHPEPLVSRYSLTVTYADCPSTPIVQLLTGHALARQLPWLATFVGTLFYADVTVDLTRYQIEPVIDADEERPVTPRPARPLAAVR